MASQETAIKSVRALTHFPLPMPAPARRETTATTTGRAISASIRTTPADIPIRTVGDLVTVTPASLLFLSA